MPFTAVFGRVFLPVLSMFLAKAARLRAVLVILREDAETERALKELGERQGIEKVSLAVMPDGPKDYKFSKEAEVTVVVYDRYKVKGNHAFRKGELNDKAIEMVLADVSSVVVPKR